MRFCPNCGTPLVAGAKFCVDCGHALRGPAQGASGHARGPLGGVGEGGPKSSITTAFVAVFAGVTIAGLAVAAFILMRGPETTHRATASASSTTGTPPSSLPEGHPTIRLPTEARTFIDEVEKTAKSKPDDAQAWTRLGTVAMRAAMFDSSYYAMAERAYSHVLKLDPQNLDALRGMGDIHYDRHRYSQAIASYTAYLKRKPNDPHVLTDLGTMYLNSGQPKQAVDQYRKAIAERPDFFNAYYNLGIAYAQNDDLKQARRALEKAVKLAPDDESRKRAAELLARVPGGAAPPASGSEVGARTRSASTAGARASRKPASKRAARSQAKRKPPPASKPKPPPAAAVSEAKPHPVVASAPHDAPPPLKTFQAAIENMVRGLPVAGSKVDSVEWPDKLKARVIMDQFPMEQMPPLMRENFLAHLKTGIQQLKKAQKLDGHVEVDLVDKASGHVMRAVSD